MNDSEDCNDGILNLTNPLDAENILYTQTEDLMYSVGLPLIAFVGVSSNTAFIFVVFRVKSMQTITNAYLTNLSATDLIFVALSCGFSITNYTKSPVRDEIMFNSWVGCTTSWFVVLTTYFASLMIITLVTVEKYYALCHPLQHMMVSGKGRTIKLLTISWLIGTVLGLVTALRYPAFKRLCAIWPDIDKFDTMPELIEYCRPLSQTMWVVSDSVLVVPFFAVFVCSMYMYTRIIMALGSRPTGEKLDDISSAAASQALQAVRVRNQVARLLIINGMIFFCCQAPLRLVQVHNIWEAITATRFMTTAQHGGLTVISRGLLLINSCINPFVYYASSSFYRSAFRQAFCVNSKSTQQHSAVA